MSINVLKTTIENVAIFLIWIIVKLNVYMDERLLFLLEYKVIYFKYKGHQAEFIPSTKLGKVPN
jgi:hypothetical protein